MKAKGIRSIVVWIGLLFVSAIPCSLSAADKCEALKSFQIPGTALEITGAQNRDKSVSKPSPFGGFQGTIPTHCNGGDKALDQFNMLEAIVDWVEKDTSPASVEASGRAFPERTRPLCPFPQYAHYTGEGNPEDAENYECRIPE